MTNREIQEWLNLHGYRIAIDGDLGPVTRAALGSFCAAKRIDQTDAAAVERELTSPMTSATRPVTFPAPSICSAVIAAALQHLAQKPREVGGQNMGPWVRLYTGGHEGIDYPWCAGFVTTILRQAERDTGLPSVPVGSLSCDELAKQATRNGRFVAGNGFVVPARGWIFLVRGKRPGDWIHTGFVYSAMADGVETIEGNTNDEGHREGYEVCRRWRGYTNLDFIRV